MYQYPILAKSARIGIHAIRILVAVVCLVAITAILHIIYLAFHINLPTGGATLAILFIIALIAWIKFALFRLDHQTLFTGGFPAPSQASHRELRTYCKYLIVYLKRLAEHQNLSDDEARDLRQHAIEIESVLGAHPLLDDLRRAIHRAENEVIASALSQLGQRRQTITLAKMQAVIEDIHQPPFPVIKPLVMIYHQITLISQIVDLYVARPSMPEYLAVIRDVWSVMTKGDFLRLGQRLFHGVYQNSPPLGRAVDDLGEAIAAMWITQSVSNAAAHRCCVIHGWRVDDAIGWMDEQTIPSLHAIRDVLVEEVLPMLRVRIRHSAPWGTQDTVEFTDSLVKGITKAVESVIRGLSQQHPGTSLTPSHPPPTYHGIESESPDPSDKSESPPPSHRRRVRKRKRRHDRARIWQLITQRFRYRRRN
ncbi:MAG TPA: hypothetical protein PKE55_09335 [Kiritimatiellia bacterium]|nr:hypothetical protein [Kiritimatiellia bacterium]